MTISLRPLGIPRLTGMNMLHLTDGAVAMEDIWGKEFFPLYDQMKSAPSIEKAVEILEHFLIRKKQSIILPHRQNDVLNALDLMMDKQGNIQVKDVQQHIHTSRKTLKRAFEHYMGTHAKQYARIVRFNAVKKFLDQNPNINNLTSVALHFGFYDCSHLISEFKRYARFTPQQFYKSKLFDNIVIQ